LNEALLLRWTQIDLRKCQELLEKK